MKRNIVILLTLLCSFVLTFFVTHVYFQRTFPYTHDGENHLARFANYQLAVREKQIPPRFAPNLFTHYGYPVFNYNYPLANILSVPFSFLHFPYEVTFKVLVFFSILLGLVGVFLWLAQLNFPLPARFFGMGVFAATPFLVSTVVFRGNIGEIMALCLFPWLFWTIEWLATCFVSRVSWRSLTLAQLSQLLFVTVLFTMFFLVHNISAVFGTPLLLLYACIRLQKNWQAYSKLFVAMGLGALLSLWFWIPALLEKNLTILETANVNTQFADHFPTLHELIFSPLQFGFSQKGTVDGLSSSVGVLQIIVCLVVIIILFRQWWAQRALSLWKWSIQRQVIAFLTLLSLGLFIGQMAWTWPIWQTFFVLTKYLQFPWRLSLFLGILLVPLAAYAFTFLSQKWRVVFVLLLIWQVIGFTRAVPVDKFHKNNEDYDFFAQSTSTNNENTPKTFTYQIVGDWQPTPTVLKGKAEIQVSNWRGSNRSYTLAVTEPSIIVEPTMNFAGWQTTLKSESQPKKVVQYINSAEIGGRVAYEVAPGNYQVQSRFTQWTVPRIIGNTLSIFTAFGIAVWLLFTVFRTYAQKTST